MTLSPLLLETFLLGILGSLDGGRNTLACSVSSLRENNVNEEKIVLVNFGKYVKLNCQIRTSGQNTKLQYYWLKDNQPPTPSNQRRMRIKLYKYLKIRRVEKEDAGLYACVAVNDCGKNTVRFFIGIAPKFTESQSKARHNLLAVPAGKSVKLECSASGYPRPTVTRYKEGLSFEERKGCKKLSLSKWSTVLSLKDLYPSDTGAYTCTVKNPLGCISQTYKVDVHDEKTRKALVPGLVWAGVLATVAALVVICRGCQYRTKKQPDPQTKLEFEYDAFVIFSSRDSNWVIKTLIPTLEEKHNFKCCVHYRDFVVGVPFRENMVNSVYESRKTIAVVSKNFFNSNYCVSEMEYALHRLMEKRDDSLVVIKLDDVDKGKLPKELRKRSYIDYQKIVEKSHWEKKLVNCLKILNDP